MKVMVSFEVNSYNAGKSVPPLREACCLYSILKIQFGSDSPITASTFQDDYSFRWKCEYKKENC